MAEQPAFLYVAITQEGERKRGKITANSSEIVSTILQEQGLIPLEITEFKKTLGNMNLTKPKEERALKLKPADEVVFARQMYLLVRAGLSIPRTLSVLGTDADDIRLTIMCEDLADKVLSGSPLSRAMEDYPKAFNDVFVAYVAAGERTGNMEEALYRLARMLDKANQLRLKVKAVTAYPKMVSIAIALVVTGIMMFLVPSFAKIYASFGAKLPFPTLVMVKISQIFSPIHIRIGLDPVVLGLQNKHIWETPINFYSPLFWTFLSIYIYKRWKKAHAEDLETMMKLNRLRYRVPVMGKLWKFSMLYRWSSTMAGALASGLQTYVAIELAGRTSGSAWIRWISIELLEAVRAGRPLSGELSKYPDLFTAQLRAMALTGEESGEPAEMFNNVALTLEDEIEAMVAVLGARLEVILLVLMGTVVGAMVVVLYLPIFGLSNAALKGLDNANKTTANTINTPSKP